MMRDFKRVQHAVGTVLVLSAVSITAVLPTSAADLPKGFVYLRDVDASILQDMRYATSKNFTGRRVPGYESDECVLAKPVAKALASVQLDLLARSLSLKVYDCYRPDRAVKAFLRWARSSESTPKTRAYHPGISKAQVISRGYVAPRSTHSTGRAVDLTIVDARNAAPAPQVDVPETSCVAPASKRAPDTGVDMGTDYDCFHARSHTNSPAIKGDAKRWRKTLVDAMRKHGFRNYAREWWHFNHPASGFDARLDFIVPKRVAVQPISPEKQVPD